MLPLSYIPHIRPADRSTQSFKRLMISPNLETFLIMHHIPPVDLSAWSFPAPLDACVFNVFFKYLIFHSFG